MDHKQGTSCFADWVERSNALGNERGDLDRQFKRDARAMRLQVFRMDLSAVFLYDSVTDAQSQTRAFANGLGRVKRIKGAVQIGETIPIIVKAKHHAAIVAACLNPYALL